MNRDIVRLYSALLVLIVTSNQYHSMCKQHHMFNNFLFFFFPFSFVSDTSCMCRTYFVPHFPSTPSHSFISIHAATKNKNIKIRPTQCLQYQRTINNACVSRTERKSTANNIAKWCLFKRRWNARKHCVQRRKLEQENISARART